MPSTIPEGLILLALLFGIPFYFSRKQKIEDFLTKMFDNLDADIAWIEYGCRTLFDKTKSTLHK